MKTQADLLRIAIKDKAMKFGDFILASGRKSDYYINMKKVLLDSHFLEMIAKLMLREIRGKYRVERNEIGTIAGVPMGGTILATAVSIMSSIENIHNRESVGPLFDHLLVRKQGKGHGTREWVEYPGEEFDSERGIVVVEDVTTTGKSSFNTLRIISEGTGKRPEGVMTLVDREEGAREFIESEGYLFDCIFTVTDIRR